MLSPMLFNIMFGAIVHGARQKYEQEGLGVQVLQKNGVFIGRRRRPENSPTFMRENSQMIVYCLPNQRMSYNKW
jgi:hypothetical protein